MKKVLMISYQYPPQGGVGPLRAHKFAKYLPSYGWQPVILTVREDIDSIKDYEFLREIPKQVVINRTGMFDPIYIYAALGKLHLERLEGGLNWMLFPDKYIFWLPFALKRGLNIIKKNKIDMIYSVYRPITSHFIAMLLSHVSNLPWVVDFRDAWSQIDNLSSYGDKALESGTFRKKLECYLERMILKRCNHIILVREIMKDLLALPAEELDSKMMIIPNGYDEEDFAFYEREDVQSRKETIYLYAGNFYPPRLPDPIFDMLRLISRKTPRPTIKFIFLGLCCKWFEEHGVDKDIEDFIELKGFVSHQETIRYLLEADVLVNIGNFGGSKAYEYLRAYKPILAISQSDSVLAKLIQETNGGVVIDSEDIERLAEVVLDFHRQKSEKGSIEFKPNKRKIKKYDRKYQAGTLARVFDSLVDKNFSH